MSRNFSETGPAHQATKRSRCIGPLASLDTQSVILPSEQAPAGPRPVSIHATKPGSSIILSTSTLPCMDFLTALKTALNYLCVNYICVYTLATVYGLPS
ncbi:hypothetical protein GQ55_4G293600 [Panicum hallii var. hallii]|uniref:Uncharacterized protein n=1 Tax=Panicum hallii var. hallii TaxID=1504633 RepID=A0A2T7E1E0_9POAL|nr:hypothetical protein GQ55_4G293600 [Panicum hallii var. hallii]